MVRERTQIFLNNDENYNTKEWANCHKIKAHQIKNGKIKIRNFQVVEYVPNSLYLVAQKYIVHHSGTPDTYSGTIDSDGNVRITKHSGTSGSSEEKTRWHIYCEADILYYDENHKKLYNSFGKKWGYVTIAGLWATGIIAAAVLFLTYYIHRLPIITGYILLPIFIVMFALSLYQLKTGKFTIYNVLFRPIKFIKLCNYNNKVKKEEKSKK